MADTVTIDTHYFVDTLKTLVSIDSILPHEERLAAFLADELRAMGVVLRIELTSAFRKEQ